MFRESKSALRVSTFLSLVSVLVVGPMQVAAADDKPVTPPSVSVLPFPDPVFKGKIGRTTANSKPDFPQPIQPPAGAPNILLIMTDDVGFGASSAFGGPIPTPTLEALAAKGIKYNEFNTTALCSPTRAALLTGRDQHKAHQGIIMERSLGYPGYDSLMPKSTGTIAEILRGNGYSTAWFGKNHNVPGWQSSAAGRSTCGRPDWASTISTASSAATPTSGIRRCSRTRRRSSQGKADRRREGELQPRCRSGGSGDPLDRAAAFTGAQQAVLRLLRARRHARAPSRAEGLDREVQGPVRSGLGQAPRGNVRATEGARNHPAGRDPDAAPGESARRGIRSTRSTRNCSPIWRRSTPPISPMTITTLAG